MSATEHLVHGILMSLVFLAGCGYEHWYQRRAAKIPTVLPGQWWYLPGRGPVVITAVFRDGDFWYSGFSCCVSPAWWTRAGARLLRDDEIPGAIAEVRSAR